MVLRWAILGVLGCAEEKAREPTDAGTCAGCGGDTAPPDTAPPEETGDSAEPADTGGSGEDTGDTGGDTGETEPEPCVSATFTADDGSIEDLTSIFTKGDYHTLVEPGTLTFCPGEWYVRLVIQADVAVVGLGKAREDTVLSGGEQGTVLSIEGPAAVSVSRLVIERGSALGVSNNSVGGGLRCKDLGEVTIEDVTFQDNAAYDGGGLYARQCVVAVSDAEFARNSGQDDGGGAYVVEGEASFQGVLFQDNEALDGGAIMTYYGAISVETSVFQGNHGINFGGAVMNAFGEAEIRSSTFLDNTSGYNGGAVGGYGRTYVEGSRFEGNAAPSGGGALSYSAYAPGDFLEGVACDFVSNDPDDVYATSSNSLFLGKGASFYCSGLSCAEM